MIQIVLIQICEKEPFFSSLDFKLFGIGIARTGVCLEHCALG